MAQAKRSQFAHYLNTTPEAQTKKWVREGIGVEALSMSYNAQVDTYKTILADEADSVFKNYDIQSSVTGKRIYRTDEIYTTLDEIRRNAKALESQYLEIDMGQATGSSYVATQYDVLVVIDEFLGEDATISYNIYYKNPKQGTATITDGVPTFVETASL